MNLEKIAIITVVLILIIVSFYDLRWRRIPNYLTLPMILFGFIFHFVSTGFGGVIISFFGFLTSFTLFWILYGLHMMGGGDVKLIGGVGAFLGYYNVIPALFFTILIGGLMAIALLLKKCNFRKTCDQLSIDHQKINAQNDILRLTNNVDTVPYGIAISLGTIITIFLY